MNDKEKVTALIELVKIRIDKYKQTRDLEFKVNIALWTLIVLIGYYYKNKLTALTTVDLIIYIFASIFLVAGHYFFWLVPVSDSMARDNAKALEFQDEIEKTTGVKSNVPLRSKNEIKKDYLRFNLFLAGITMLLLILLGVFFII